MNTQNRHNSSVQNSACSSIAKTSLPNLLKEVGKQRLDLWRAQTAQHQAIIVIPAYCLEREELEKALGVDSYEERAIWTIGRRQDGVKIVFVTSAPLSDAAREHLASRLPPIAAGSVSFVSVNDTQPGLCLAERLVLRPDVVAQIKEEIGDRKAWLMPYFARHQDFAIGELLEIPVEGSLPALQYWGTKSGSRTIFAEANVAHPAGEIDLSSEDEILDAISSLWSANPTLAAVFVKINAGISGFGILKIELPSHAPRFGRKEILRKQLVEAAGGEDILEQFLKRFHKHQGVVEAAVANVSSSPSGQGYISADNKIAVVATHEQILAGQIYLGASFPAEHVYRAQIQEATLRVGQALASKGAQGFFSVDFVIADGKPYAVEINLRQVGTLHYLHTAKYLRNASFYADSGRLIAADGQDVYYIGSDNLKFKSIKGSSPEALLAQLDRQGILFDQEKGEGAIFHLLGLVEPHGKVGCTVIAGSAARASELFSRVENALRVFPIA